MKEISAAIRTAREEPTSANLEAMWEHVMHLPAWYMLPAEVGEETTPLVAELDDGAWILAFTHFRALNEFAREAGLRTDSGDVPMLAVTPADATRRVGDLATHVDGIAFNLGTELAFRSPVAQLQALAMRL